MRRTEESTRAAEKRPSCTPATTASIAAGTSEGISRTSAPASIALLHASPRPMLLTFRTPCHRNASAGPSLREHAVHVHRVGDEEPAEAELASQQVCHDARRERRRRTAIAEIDEARCAVMIAPRPEAIAARKGTSRPNRAARETVIVGSVRCEFDRYRLFGEMLPLLRSCRALKSVHERHAQCCVESGSSPNERTLITVRWIVVDVEDRREGEVNAERATFHGGNPPCSYASDVSLVAPIPISGGISSLRRGR
jgi:hypothetical protein